MMDSREHLFYGLGMIAYSVAIADGQIQATEKNELRNMLHEWCKDLDVNFDVSEIIFSILTKSKPSYQDGYQSGMHHIELGKQYLTEKLKEKFIYLIKDIAHAFPPVTIEELNIVTAFEKDLTRMN